MAYNFVTKEPTIIVAVSGEVADKHYNLFLLLKQTLGFHEFKDDSEMKTLLHGN
jgi:hypothetical protein